MSNFLVWFDWYEESELLRAASCCIELTTSMSVVFAVL